MSLTQLNRKFETDGTVTRGVEFAIGGVLATYSKETRIMSDVYADVTYAVVRHNAATIDIVRVGDNEFGWDYDVSVDAPQEHIDAWKANVEAVEASTKAARLEQERIDAEKRFAARTEAERKAPLKGRIVTVNRGRRIAKGTEGFVFWTSDTNNKIGIATSERRDPSTGRFMDVVFVDAANCDANDIGNLDCDVQARKDAMKAGWNHARQATGPTSKPPTPECPF